MASRTNSAFTVNSGSEPALAAQPPSRGRQHTLHTVRRARWGAGGRFSFLRGHVRKYRSARSGPVTGRALRIAPRAGAWRAAFDRLRPNAVGEVCLKFSAGHARHPPSPKSKTRCTGQRVRNTKKGGAPPWRTALTAAMAYLRPAAVIGVSAAPARVARWRVAAGDDTSPCVLRYPAGPNVVSLTYSATNWRIPGMAFTWAFLT